ncbi:pyroglutamyl-peptidase I [Bifidobacterium vespertilionis]|uniref:Pyroglutamyl-peptidase I n=1 Tax=Bifidobacterium vespertilionis TaxID=2562524 RepID=A0A5J5E1K4_9BIFI|nr:pyroglutamyl-peptidase I [Bifidobacterium vespertilionis]KAA8818372.1 pyroglutamyl-peptidase I [Bifidobacterium vespertilionis]KAA8822852.1 pyroglutamyl-peptidase I [Bifidobacterium vespertilionis]MBT1179969.1 pyroglutamyl-peptidase I [Bifidobacterium vespertilionis]
MERFNVVVCGFGQYEGVTVNPAYEVPRALATQGLGVPVDEDDPLNDVDVAVSAVSMPVSFTKSWPVLHEAIEATNPRIVVAMGLKKAARGIALERCATNRVGDDRPDADNVTPTYETINPDGPAAYWTRLPLRAILADFTAGNIPATLSSDAGTYVCNSLFYQLLDWTASQERVISGFVSLPMVNESGDRSTPGLPLNQQIEAGRAVIREAVRYWRQPSSADILIA